MNFIIILTIDSNDLPQKDRGTMEKRSFKEFLQRARQGREKKDKMVSVDKIKTRNEKNFKKGKGIKTITGSRYKLVLS